MPKLLQINSTLNWGSTGKIAEDIGKAAIAHGWKSYIAYGRYSNSSESKDIKVGWKLGVYAHYVLQRIFDREGLYSKIATKRLIAKIKKIGPDIIHLHNLHDHYINYNILFKYLNSTKIPIVWTFHDFWPVTGHCMHFITADCERYKSGCFECPMKNRYPKTVKDNSRENYKIKKRLFSSSENLTLVAVSQWVGKCLSESFLKDKPIHVINNGIDLCHFKPTEDYEIMQRFANKFVILSVASQWKYDKGLEYYIKIAKLLSDDEVIVLVGVDKSIAVELPRNIIAIERTDNQRELAALYTVADVVTILSSAETFGMTVVEGYACGTPAVVYDNTAPPYLITSETGFVVENKNYYAVYDAIQMIKARGKNFYSSKCIEQASRFCNKAASSERYMVLYDRLLENNYIK